MRKLLISVILLYSLVGCEQKYIEPFKVYTIKEGQHSSVIKSESLQSTKLNFKAKFNQSVIYSSKIAENQWDTNKLLGFSDCNSHHQQNSARFGWRWFNNQIEIRAYVYANKVLTYLPIGTVEIGETASYKIEIKDDRYIFSLNNYDPVIVERGNTCKRGLYYMLWPYFGGQETPDHDIHIYIKREF